MALKTKVISSFASFLLGFGTFERIKDIVLRQEDTGLKGDQKRKAAIEEFKILGLGVASWAVNLAIELAVAYFRTLAGEKPNVK